MKYMGSKARLAKDIAPILQKMIDENNITTYIEPFVGGANMIEHIKCKKKIGADSNNYLISMWNEIKKGYVPPKEITREMYNKIKDNKNDFPEHLVAVVGFCATYNAKWFGGYAGCVTTKHGNVRNYYDEAVRNIMKQVPKVSDVEFVCCDYTKFSSYSNCVIYCDPPYENTTKYKMDFNHSEFWDWVRRMSKRNIVIVSEYNAPSDFCCIYQKQLVTTLDKNSRKNDIEKLFVLNN